MSLAVIAGAVVAAAVVVGATAYAAYGTYVSANAPVFDGPKLIPDVRPATPEEKALIGTEQEGAVLWNGRSREWVEYDASAAVEA